jgi:hypothetical protein
MAKRPFALASALARGWFPAVLVLVGLLALPGVLLLVMHLAGQEAYVNRLLQEWFHLSYHLPLPGWLGGLLLLVPPALVLLYFLKLKRKPLQVPSTFLWKKSIEDLHVNTLFQWLRDNVLLLLQLLTLVLLVYSLLMLQFHGTNTEGTRYIIMIDNSASMNATDVAPSRLEQAKKEALAEIDSHTDNDSGMIIVFNSSAEILQSFTSDRNKLRDAVAHVKPTLRPTRIEEALTLASSLANPKVSTEDRASKPEGEDPSKARTYVPVQGVPTQLHLFSDGRFPDVPDFQQGNLDMRLHPIGEPGSDKVDNVAIVTVNAVRDDRDPSKIEVLANVRNYRNKPVPVKVGLEVRVNGELADTFERLAQPPGGGEAPDKAGDKGTAHTVVRVEGGKVTLRPRGATDKKSDKVVDPAEVPFETTEGGKVDVRQLGYGHPVLEKNGRVLVEIVGRREVRPATDKDPGVDRPGEGFASFDLADVDERSQVVLRAYLVNHKDRFAVDDEAWLVLGQVRKARVLIVGTPRNRILSAFFDQESTKKVAEVTYLDKEDLKDEAKYRRPAREGKFDLVVFDRCAPPKTAKAVDPKDPEQGGDMPQANTFFIGTLPPPPDDKPWKTETVKGPHVKGWLTKDPIMRSLTALYDVGIAEAFKFDLNDPRVPPRTPRLLESDQDTALLFSLSRQSYTDLVMAFPLINDDRDFVTNWPLQPSFPLFLRNVLYVLGNVSDAASEENVQPGQVKTIRPDTEVPNVEVVPPGDNGLPAGGGKGTELEKVGSRPFFTFGDTEKQGVYAIKWDPAGGSDRQVHRQFAVNLLDADESNVEPRSVETVKIGAAELSKGETRFVARDLWKWVALAALVLLLLEWYVYNKRIFV